jgi:hypothetical protein
MRVFAAAAPGAWADATAPWRWRSRRRSARRSGSRRCRSRCSCPRRRALRTSLVGRTPARRGRAGDQPAAPGPETSPPRATQPGRRKRPRPCVWRTWRGRRDRELHGRRAGSGALPYARPGRRVTVRGRARTTRDANGHDRWPSRFARTATCRGPRRRCRCGKPRFSPLVPSRMTSGEFLGCEPTNPPLVPPAGTSGELSGVRGRSARRVVRCDRPVAPPRLRTGLVDAPDGGPPIDRSNRRDLRSRPRGGGGIEVLGSGTPDPDRSARLSGSRAGDGW